MNLEPNSLQYYNNKYATCALHSFNPENKRRFLKVMEHIKGKYVLDVGCGEGVLVNLLTGKGLDAFGIDFSPIAIARARQGRYTPGGVIKTIGNFAIANIKNSFGFGKNTFTTICMCEIIEHFKNTDFLFNEAKRVLKPEGRIVITTPAYKREGFPEHERDFDAVSLSKLLSVYGKPFIEQISELHFVGYVDIPK